MGVEVLLAPTFLNGYYVYSICIFRCSNRGLVTNATEMLSFTVDQGENRWECELSEESVRNERESGETLVQVLKRYHVEIDRFVIKCPSLVYGACHAALVLQEIPDNV